PGMGATGAHSHGESIPEGSAIRLDRRRCRATAPSPTRGGVRMSASTIPCPISEATPLDAQAGYSVSDLCRRWRIGAAKLHGFLRRGEMSGSNIAASLLGRPQWRITPESVEAFERRRSSAPPPKPPRKRRRPFMKDYYP